MSITVEVKAFKVARECVHDTGFFADVIGEISDHFEEIGKIENSDLAAWCEDVKTNLDDYAKAVIRALAAAIEEA